MSKFQFHNLSLSCLLILTRVHKLTNHRWLEATAARAELHQGISYKWLHAHVPLHNPLKRSLMLQNLCPVWFRNTISILYNSCFKDTGKTQQNWQSPQCIFNSHLMSLLVDKTHLLLSLSMSAVHQRVSTWAFIHSETKAPDKYCQPKD